MPTQDLISKAAKIIKSGGLVIHPTDTCYGLAANALDPLAVKKIYRLKGRDFNKPLIICVRDLKMAKDLVRFNPTAEKLFRKFLPGPLTLVLPSKLHPGQKDAIRLPNHPVTLALSKTCSVPYTTTSANLSGKPNPYSLAEVFGQFSHEAIRQLFILDAGPLPPTPPSTVIDVSGGKIKILRSGPISLSQLRS